MKNDPFFSVVIPTYNRAGLILKTLESVFKQTYSHYEIVVVDNGSTDNTLEVLAPLEKEGKIRVIRNPVNQERSVSRNLGFEAARGDFATLLDSDDLMYPTNLQDAVNYIRGNPDMHFFHNLYHLVNTQNEVIYKYRFPANRNTHRDICNGNFLSCIGVFMSKEIYSAYRFEINPIILGSEDWEFWIRVAAKYKLGRIPKINSAIVHHPGRSITGFTLESIIKRKKFILDQINLNPDLFKVYEAYTGNVNISANLFAASMANSAGMYHEARKYLWKALKNKFLLIFDVKFLRILQIATFKIQHKHNI